MDKRQKPKSPPPAKKSNFPSFEELPKATDIGFKNPLELIIPDDQKKKLEPLNKHEKYKKGSLTNLKDQNGNPVGTWEKNVHPTRVSKIPDRQTSRKKQKINESYDER